MARYKVVPKIKLSEEIDEDEDDFDPELRQGEVYSDMDDTTPESSGYVNTGLLDASGDRIFRREYKNQIGFLWHDDNGSLQPRHRLLQEEPSEKIWVTEDCLKEKLITQTPLHERDIAHNILASNNMANMMKLWEMLAGDQLPPDELLSEEQLAEMFGLADNNEEENGA